MSTLTLVRHAQASFHAADYDQLSPLGETQARRLGAHWLEAGLAFDEVHTGPRKRHQQTAAIVGACFRAAGRHWPEPVVLTELDEFDSEGVIRILTPLFARQDPEFDEQVRRFREPANDAEMARRFQRMFEMLMTHWLEAGDDVAGIESWSVFRERVRSALARLVTQPGPGRRVVAFTSGGFIGTSIAQVLCAPERSALELAWRIRNGALTELVFTPGRLTLDSFNAVPHLAAAELWTYR